MIDLEVLALYGIDYEGLKKKFNKPRNKRADKHNALIDRIVNRAQGGRDLKLEQWHVYHALDAALDTCFKQITPTLLATLADKSASDATVMDTLKALGLDPARVIQEVADPKTPGKNIKKISVPAFHQIFVPLVKAYTTIRWAKIVNDRRLVPFFKYEPVISDEISRLRCDVITGRAETMSRQYGYFDVMKQNVWKTLIYSESVQFPVEEWHSEEQCVAQDSPLKGETVEVTGSDGKTHKVKKVTTKEGIRYHLPHPTRFYYDLAFPPSSMNTDTGTQYAGYWRVCYWKDVMANEAFYNKEEIGWDRFNEWHKGYRNHGYWINALKGCVSQFPSDNETATSATSRFDTEKKVNQWYSKDWSDKPIVLTEHFEKIIPKEHDLGDYEYPVWMRFVLAADDNVIYAAPVGYNPLLWTGYDWAEGRTHNASMALEIMPFQDQYSNLLSQYLLTIRQNLANLTFVDTDVLEEKAIDKIEGFGETWWRGINIIRASFKRFKEKLGSNPERALLSHKLPYQDATQLLNGMKIILDTLERMLAISSQELGQAASHEQTREEVRHISVSTSTRVTFTSLAVDVQRDAWKRQIYYALMAHGTSDFYSQVHMEQEIEKTALEKMGFTYEGDYNKRDHKAIVKAKNKTSLAFESFVADRDGQDRVKDVESARVMIEFLDRVLKYPQSAQAMGNEQVIKLLNQISRLFGLPRDFKLINEAGEQMPPDQQMQGMVEEIRKYIDQAVIALSEDVKGALGQIGETNNAQDQAIQKITQQMQQLMQAMGGLNAVEPPVPMGGPGELDNLGDPNMMQAMGGS